MWKPDVDLEIMHVYHNQLRALKQEHMPKESVCFFLVFLAHFLSWKSQTLIIASLFLDTTPTVKLTVPMYCKHMVGALKGAQNNS